MPLEYHAITDVGKQRKENEDSYSAIPELGLFLVADGMGGQAAGEVASRMAADAISQFIRLSAEKPDITWPTPYEPSLSHDHNRLRAAVILANKEIFLAALSRFPTQAEKQKFTEYLSKQSRQAAGLANVMWAVLNTNEFILNH